MARPTGIKSKTIPLRIPRPLQDKIKAAAARLGLSDQDIMRMAMAVGLEALKRVNWDLDKLVVDSAFPGTLGEVGKIIAISPDPTVKAAEEKTTDGPGGDE